jgi:hypothetical protein
VGAKPIDVKLPYDQPEVPRLFSGVQTSNTREATVVRYNGLLRNNLVVRIEKEESMSKKEPEKETVGFLTLWGDDITYSNLDPSKHDIKDLRAVEE